MKSMGVLDIWVKFHMCLICIFLVFKVQVFSNQQNRLFYNHFRLFLGCFLTITPPNVVKLDGNINQLCHADQRVRYVTVCIEF